MYDEKRVAIISFEQEILNDLGLSRKWEPRLKSAGWWGNILKYAGGHYVPITGP